ncbi:amidohydrolase family protein [Clostridium sp. MCC353]|uniref:amidohydrolase family protein n=1 Tax=Clostridium sp. MCC353 TaxID=2592646 RepID=UPI001C01A099|nr:amidohydrolase family protein [Clostridium sp. MCC353]MBT9779353.1 amidohydrolase family protein [Clostridium sp. MCC353]
MKIIDAHLHFCLNDQYFDGIAAAAGHDNNAAHLWSQYEKLGITGGVVMGNRGLEPERHQYPEFLRYCIGLDSHYMELHKIEDAIGQVEYHLKQDQCAGVKLYPGYNPYYITDPMYDPVYELAAFYKKPVAVHTGETAGPNALLKYSHPLTLDEAAVRHPDVQFVMCHFGNPWLNDAAAVVSKNRNVAADLSGLLEGRVMVPEFLKEKKGYVAALQTWLEYISYDRIMFGTDWPLVNLKDYIEFIACIVPERYQEQVFYENAARIYGF